MSFVRYYHGDGGDHIGQVGLLLNGNGRFKVLWEDGKIKPGFGVLSGVTKEAVKDIINHPTLSNRTKRIDGRQLLLKAKAAIRESKILLAYWTDYTRNGGFPSGKNEEDALLFCTESVSTENSKNLEKEEDTEEEDDEDQPAVSQSRVLTQPLRGKAVVQNEDNEEEDEDEAEAEDEGGSEDEGDGDIEFVTKKATSPAALVTFMLLGPYGCEAYGFPLSSAFSIDTEAIEKVAKTGQFNTKSMKEEKRVATDIVR